MAALVNRSYLQASSSTLATDLARYGSAAVWRGVYYRGDKIDAAKKYAVSGWASVNEGTEGPPVYDLVSKHVERLKKFRIEKSALGAGIDVGA